MADTSPWELLEARAFSSFSVLFLTCAQSAYLLLWGDRIPTAWLSVFHPKAISSSQDAGQGGKTGKVGRETEMQHPQTHIARSPWVLWTWAKWWWPGKWLERQLCMTLDSMGLTPRNEHEHHGEETLVQSNPPVQCRYPSTHSYCLASQPKCWKRQPGGRLSSLSPAPWQDPLSLSPSWHICPSNLQHWWYHPSPPPGN